MSARDRDHDQMLFPGVRSTSKKGQKWVGEIPRPPRMRMMTREKSDGNNMIYDKAWSGLWSAVVLPVVLEGAGLRLSGPRYNKW